MSNIRQANTNDSAAVKSLVSETLLHCVFEGGDAYRTLFGEICKLIDSWVDSPMDAVHSVYENDGNIVGVVFISQYDRLNLLFVHPTQQRFGIGKSLLDSALEACRKSGKSNQITLNSSNYAAPFYLKYGFIPNGKPEDKPGGCMPLIINL
jgi:GNAT superfamily N-acetyltransferase